MPLARISVSQETTAEALRAISDTVYESMVTVANVPANDKFQILSRHAKGELVYPEQGFLGVNYSDNIVFIQITWNEGRSTEVKKAFYRAIADGIQAKTGLRKEDIIINLVEVQRENWSFGNGDMPFAPV
ncbi:MULTISPECIES: tautomerase family protein [unclassified Janthinobacterium]|uniref:tautomerase family protein n=1 Tax=unclassified Janthinobacterium TaxID=2610881 RepID=UPI00160C6DEB|nr:MULTISPECIES: tautomerase family protein [unclassified Janthinobacterium]MBB5370652.1 phenylpyruvate tautomerase PptA (4-oxalocrotonate tautomerase family) [Janthinobacterium sp. K2C7]MBB5383458.1 phenylpyruvate tautomerase PptA (4-oxalocrotonate tautomerase family) [Janthinobacterium sp. K2Li3]MBB5388912.1 phenylpyruvate tautomerase PptA (4-oxalocrotonate tautomerase family) [Janthinobacterium sp. K2E3]